MLTRAQVAETIGIAVPNTYRYFPVTRSSRISDETVAKVLNDHARNGQPQVKPGEWLPKLVDISAVSAELGVSAPAIRKWIDKGAPHYHFDRKVMFDMDTISAWAASPAR